MGDSSSNADKVGQGVLLTVQPLERKDTAESVISVMTPTSGLSSLAHSIDESDLDGLGSRKGLPPRPALMPVGGNSDRGLGSRAVSAPHLMPRGMSRGRMHWQSARSEIAIRGMTDDPHAERDPQQGSRWKNIFSLVSNPKEWNLYNPEQSDRRVRKVSIADSYRSIESQEDVELKDKIKKLRGILYQLRQKKRLDRADAEMMDKAATELKELEGRQRSMSTSLSATTSPTPSTSGDYQQIASLLKKIGTSDDIETGSGSGNYETQAKFGAPRGGWTSMDSNIHQPGRSPPVH